eukprot:scaffold1962_cov162-Amphora_coffeaeformis.AAC.3
MIWYGIAGYGAHPSIASFRHQERYASQIEKGSHHFSPNDEETSVFLPPHLGPPMAAEIHQGSSEEVLRAIVGFTSEQKS